MCFRRRCERSTRICERQPEKTGIKISAFHLEENFLYCLSEVYRKIEACDALSIRQVLIMDSNSSSPARVGKYRNITRRARSMSETLVLKKGIYGLVVRVLQRSSLEIGRLGTFDFPAGFYVYVGSAQNNLEHRIKRHLQREKKVRWHIDYLLPYGRVVSVHTYAGEKKKECVLSRKIGKMRDASAPVKGFGSSDCSCYSHLYFFQHAPVISRLRI